jgi:hypothetical protein
MSYIINSFRFGGPFICPENLISLSGIQAYYKFENSPGDSSNNGRTLTLVNSPTYAAGKFGSGIVLNGTSQYATLPAEDYSIANAFTLSTWIKTTATTEQHIITRDKVNMTPSSDNRRLWQFRIDASTGVLRLVRFQNNTTVLSNFASSAAVNTGNWVHVAAVFDNTVGSKLYINGVEDGSDALTTNNNNVSDSNPVIGAIQGATGGGPQSFFNGMIDDAAIFNRALSSSEIAAIAAGTCPLKTPPSLSISGGTITTSGGYTYHTFTASTDMYVEGTGEIDFLIVAGGGGGGRQQGGGGGAGGALTGSTTLTAGTFTVTIGSGGAGGTSNAVAAPSGSNSTFNSLTANGGGGGGGVNADGASGGSGGGGGANNIGASGTAGQGFSGGTGYGLAPSGGGGGGGAGAIGAAKTASPDASTNAAGGSGIVWLNGTTYAGGGGGGKFHTSSVVASAGGAGGGGGGGLNFVGAAGTANLGGGGGGGGQNASTSYNGGNGGSGVVIIRYPTP